jgi:uncharacterized membrane protein
MSDANYEHLWQDQKNWGGGFCGWYFCKEDPRLWVPKKNKALGITVNLGHPKGGATLVTLFLTPTIFLVLGLLVSVAVCR